MFKIYGVGIDRIIRVIAGVILVSAGFMVHGKADMLLWSAGAVMIIAGITGACAFGSSCAVEPVKVKIQEEEKK